MKPIQLTVPIMLGVLLQGVPGNAQAQLCFELFESRTDPTLSCADAFYFVDDPEGSGTQLNLEDSSSGLLEAQFDGFDLFDPGLAPPDNLLEPFFADIQHQQSTVDGEIDSFETQHRGGVSMGARDSSFQLVSYGSTSRITFTPLTTDGSTDPVILNLDFDFDFTMSDPSENATSGGSAVGGSAMLYTDDFQQNLFGFSGLVQLELDFGPEPEFFGDFDGPASSFAPTGPGIDDEFDIDIQFSSTAQVEPGRRYVIESGTFGEIFTDGFDSGDTSAWTIDSGDTLVFRVGSGNPNVRFMIEAEDAPFSINAGLNDAWFNPATSGQGFFVNVFPDIQSVFLAWFTYDTERPPEDVMATVGEPGHRWITAFGPYNGNTAELDIEITSGGVFNSEEPMPTQEADGTITLDFSGCNAGTVTYDIPSIGRQGVVPIERIALDNVGACEALAGLAESGLTFDDVAGDSQPAGEAFTINPGLNDAWFNPLTAGQGFFMNVFPDIGQMFLAWFTYDTERPDESVAANLGDAGHRWITAFGPYADNQAELDIEITEGGIFDTVPPAPTQRADGTLTVDMADCENGTISYDIASAGLQGEIPIERIALDNVGICESFATQVNQTR